MNLTIHRGTKEIGGTCIELRHDGFCLILDLGLPLVDASGEDFRLPDDADANMLLAEGILPAVSSLLAGADASRSAVVISHAHQDHHGLLRFVNAELPVYMTRGTEALLQASVPFIPNAYLPPHIHRIKPWKSVEIGPFTVTPHLMDHSAPDAIALQVDVAGTSLFYSGDFRTTGRKAVVYDRLVKRPPKDIDLLLMEGTMFGREGEPPVTETDLEYRLAGMLREAQGLTVMFASGQNLDRLVTAYLAAKHTGKTLVIDLYQAWVLDHLRPLSSNIPQAEWPEIMVWFPKPYMKRLLQAERGDYFKGLRKKEITLEQIAVDGQNLLLHARPSRPVWEVLDKLPSDRPPRLLWSMWSGYLDKPTAFNSERKRRQLEVTQLHTSGHATVANLKRLADALQPKKIIPIHTFHPDKYSQVFQNVTQLKDGEVLEL